MSEIEKRKQAFEQSKVKDCTKLVELEELKVELDLKLKQQDKGKPDESKLINVSH